ncbi:MAG: hypothetical protein H0V16_02490 [Burkholderiaceae bacterium]|nr:hypothetical protein [Burkholderiaceae bacterium]
MRTDAERVAEIVAALEAAPGTRLPAADDPYANAGIAELLTRIEQLESKPRAWRFTVVRDSAGYITSIEASPEYVH